jgi:hypothetical protein
MRIFVLEQIGFWNKKAIDQILFSFRDTSNETVHPLLWFAASTFYLGLHLYLLYWIFAWGSIEQNNNVRTWGAIYGVREGIMLYGCVCSCVWGGVCVLW